VQGVGKLLRRAGVQVIQGKGQFVAPRTLEVKTADGAQRVDAKKVVVATGSQPMRFPLSPLRTGRCLAWTVRLSAHDEPCPA